MSDPLFSDPAKLIIVNLAMVGLRSMCHTRSDAYAVTCAPLWRREQRPDLDDLGVGFPRYHWRAAPIGEDVGTTSCLHAVLLSLANCPCIRALDLRGNGLTIDDAQLLLQHISPELKFLNQIPLAATELELLELDRNLPEQAEGMAAEDESGVFARAIVDTEVVRLDEGDGWLLETLLAPDRVPELRALSIRHHALPSYSAQRGALFNFCEVLRSLPKLSAVYVRDCALSSAGSAALLETLAELAPHLQTFNGLPLQALHAAAPRSHAVSLDDAGVEWGDLTLGFMARRQLWDACSGPQSVDVRQRGITDAGVRGVISLCRASRLVVINLAGNPQITDAAVAELCRAVRTGDGLPQLRDFNARCCQALRARSAHCLIDLAWHAGERLRALQWLNGVELSRLQATKDLSAATRGGGCPPAIVRVVLPAKPDAPPQMLSECDAHFIAGILHHNEQVPFLHVHLQLEPWDSSVRASPVVHAEEPPPARTRLRAAAELDGQGTNLPWRGQAEARAQLYVDAVQKFLDAVPVSTRVHVSIAPRMPWQVGKYDAYSVLSRLRRKGIGSPPPRRAILGSSWRCSGGTGTWRRRGTASCRFSGARVS